MDMPMDMPLDMAQNAPYTCPDDSDWLPPRHEGIREKTLIGLGDLHALPVVNRAVNIDAPKG